MICRYENGIARAEITLSYLNRIRTHSSRVYFNEAGKQCRWLALTEPSYPPGSAESPSNALTASVALLAVVKFLTKTTRGRVYSGSQFGGTVHYSRKVTAAGAYGGRPATAEAQLRKRRGKCWHSSSSLHSLRTPAHRTVLPTFQVAPPTSV